MLESVQSEWGQWSDAPLLLLLSFVCKGLHTSPSAPRSVKRALGRSQDEGVGKGSLRPETSMLSMLGLSET